jgi:hypothetical protein
MILSWPRAPVLDLLMLALLRSQVVFRVPMLLLASALAGFSLWVTLAELARSGIRQLPTNSDALAIAAAARARAARAAAFGDVRGDLWAEAAFAYATLLSPGEAQADQSEVAAQARTVIERALARGPYESSVWLLAARLGSRFNWPNADPASTLKMSYYTGPNELHLIPLRLLTATQSNALTDSGLQQLVQRDVRMILTRWPELRPALSVAYEHAEPDAKQFLESAVTDTDPRFLQSMRANTRP